MSEQIHKLETVLLVDDEKLILEMLTDLLEGECERILTAKNGQEGFEKALSEQPDLIISDLMMPEMNGFELLKAIRENDETLHIPFIILTVKDSFDDLSAGYSFGADYYLPKPFKPESLLHALEKAIYVRNKANKSDVVLDDEDFV